MTNYYWDDPKKKDQPELPLDYKGSERAMGFLGFMFLIVLSPLMAIKKFFKGD
jgi:hypothetical protein